MKGDGEPDRSGEGAEFEDLRLKTSFRTGRQDEQDKQDGQEAEKPKAEHLVKDGEHLSPALVPTPSSCGEGEESRTTTRTTTSTILDDDAGLLVLRPYQKAVFEDHTSGIVVLHWSRQIGKSFVLAAWAVLRLLSRPGRLITVLSNSRENGAEFLNKCVEICALNGTRFDTVVRSHPRLEFEDMRMELRIPYRGKIGRIKVLAANPRTARGFSGDLILDEFAFHEDGKAVWAAAEPILASNKDFLCRIASTGNGKHNMFYRIVEGGSFLTTDGHGLTRISETAREYARPTSDRLPLENGNIEHRTSNAEHRIEEGKVMAGMVVDGVAYVPGRPNAELGEGQKGKIEPGAIKNAKLKIKNGSAKLEDAEGQNLNGEVSSAVSVGMENSKAAEDCRSPRPGGDIEATPCPYFISKAGFKVSRVTRTMAHAMGVPIYDSQTREAITPEQAREQALDKRAYDQNYECAFTDENLALLTHELISAAESDDEAAKICEQDWTKEALEVMRVANSPLYAGLDVGRKVDLSVLTVLERVGNVYHVRGMLRMRNMRLPDQEERLKELRQCRQLKQVCIDMTGLGLGLFEYAQRTMGEHMVSGINFSSSVSATRVIREEGTNREKVRVTEAMAMEVLRVYEDRRMRQPRDWQLREDLRKPEKVTSPSGKVSIAAVRDGGGHADHFWSLALALEAAGGSNSTPFVYEAIKLRSRGLGILM